MTAPGRSGTLQAMEDPLTPPPLFPSIICGTDNGAAGVAARRQAAWLAEPDGALELIPALELTGRGPAALADRCEGHDLLVLGSESVSYTHLTLPTTPYV